ncbi:uncharacterized protein [Panulirus ornatus]
MACKCPVGRPRLVVDRCCCRWSLRTGVLIIAVLEIVFCIIFAVLYGVQNKSPLNVEYGISTNILIAQVLEPLIHGGVACVLIYGIWKRRRQLVWAWLWVRGVLLLTDISTPLFSALIFTNWVICLMFSLISVVVCYNMVVVRSYALNMKEKEEEDEEHVYLEEEDQAIEDGSCTIRYGHMQDEENQA